MGCILRSCGPRVGSDRLAAGPVEGGGWLGKGEECMRLEVWAEVSQSGWGASEHGGGVVVLCGASRGCAHPSLQSLLLCVPTVVVTTWFSWLCRWGPPVGSRGRKSSCQLSRSLPALSVTLPVTGTTVPGLTAPHLRHWSPMTATGGASAPVSIGQMR